MQLHTAPSFFFFFNDTATTEIYTLSLHDALPISLGTPDKACATSDADFTECRFTSMMTSPRCKPALSAGLPGDRKSTRLNSSHSQISYAVFCLKKKKYTCNHAYT